MNQASSRYVDQFAIQKLLQEKLSLVHHVPDRRLLQAAIHNPPARSGDANEWRDLPAQAAWVEEMRSASDVEVVFPSALTTGYPENDVVRCRRWSAGQPTGDLILVHGLYEDNRQLYAPLISLLNAGGLSVSMLTLPYHYDRQPASSRFSGEYFWSADVFRSALACRQALYDLSAFYHYVRTTAGRPVCVVGFSMGGAIALLLAAKLPLDGVFAVNPVCNMGELVWNSLLFTTIRIDLEAAGVGLADVKAIYSAFEPLNIDRIETDRTRIVLGKSLYDQINDPGNCDRLAQRWQLGRVLPYKAGHLNVVRVPKLAADILELAAEILPP